MYYSQLLMLSNSFSENTLDNMDKYLSGLSPAAQKLITISKVSDALQLDYQMCIRDRCSRTPHGVRG